MRTYVFYFMKLPFIEFFIHQYRGSRLAGRDWAARAHSLTSVVPIYESSFCNTLE